MALCCKDCTYFDDSSRAGSVCKRYPPNLAGLWPVVISAYWCGEFQEKHAGTIEAGSNPTFAEQRAMSELGHEMWAKAVEKEDARCASRITSAGVDVDGSRLSIYSRNVGMTNRPIVVTIVDPEGNAKAVALTITEWETLRKVEENLT